MGVAVQDEERASGGRGEVLRLYLALGISSGDVVAFAGAGGKSGAILSIARELVDDGMRVIVAPTTKMLLTETERVGPLVTLDKAGDPTSRIKSSLVGSGAVAVGSGLLSKKRVSGVEPDFVSALAKLVDVVLVETDGSRRRPIKGTAGHEPLLPGSSTLVVAVANIHALGKPVDEEHVHRPQLFSDLTDIGPGQSITAHAFALALAHGSLRDLPEGARPAALLTGVEPGRSMSAAALVTRELWKTGVKKVVLSSLPQESPGRVWVP
jgi:probable selenium-dependent hydroxylase accessory protein YqeC